MTAPSVMGAVRPYPGLRPFESHEVDIFFGRDAQVDQILAKLSENRFLALVGTSGCGKSSLARAGLIPALGLGLIAEAGHRWRMATLKPGESPLHNLAKALLKPGVLGPPAGGDAGQPAPDALDFVRAGLRRGPRGLAEVLADPLTPGLGPALPDGHKLMILVDQFEEIFRYRRVGDSKEADAFVALLVATARQVEVPAYVVITMRSDYLGDCAVFEGLPEVLNDSQFLTPRLSREQRQEAIEGPARVFGGDVEAALVNRLLNDMGPDPDQLPLMQHALTRLWAMAEAVAEGGPVVLRLDDYKTLGGLEWALHGHAEDVFDRRLTGPQKQTTEILFRCLSERETDGPDAVRRDIRRPTLLADVASVARVPEAEVAAVVEVFREPELCFLIPPASVPLDGSTMLDVTHESLIRRWGRLQRWVEDEAELAKTYLRYVQSARLWERGETGLLAPPELEFAVKWLRSPLTTPVWARRYGGDFTLAARYIEASEAELLRGQEEERARLQAQQDAEKQALVEQEKVHYERELSERERQKEIEAQLQKERFARLWLRSVAVAFFVAFFLALWALYERASAERARVRAESERDQLRDVVDEVRVGVQTIIGNVPREVDAEVKRSGAPLVNAIPFLGNFAQKISIALQQAVLKNSIAHYKAILDKHENLQIRSGRAALYRELGRIQYRQHQFAEAQASFGLAVDDQKDVLFSKDPDRGKPRKQESRRELSQSYTDLAFVLGKADRKSDAAQAEAARAALWPDPKEERLEKARELASWIAPRALESGSTPEGRLDAELADGAVAALQQSVDRGLRDARKLDDEIFEPLRMRADFQQLRRRLVP